MTDTSHDYIPSQEGTIEPTSKPRTVKKRVTRKTTKTETPIESQTELPISPLAKAPIEPPAPSSDKPTRARPPRTPKTKTSTRKKTTESPNEPTQAETLAPPQQAHIVTPTELPSHELSKTAAELQTESPQAKQQSPPKEFTQSPQQPAGQQTYPSRESTDSYARRGGRFGRRSRGYDRRRKNFARNEPGEYEAHRSSEPHEAHASSPEPASQEPYVPTYAEGIVEVSGKGFGFLRESQRNFTQSNNDVFVTPEVIRKYNLRDGLLIKGEIRRGNRGLQLFRLTEIEGIPGDDFPRLPVFEELTTINPLERIKLETAPDRYTTRVIDLMTPIGKGQRGLIVAPPRTGKTTLLHQIAEAVVQNHPEMKLIILLVDERPEEVTEMRRNLPTAELMASSNDSDIKSHTRISQLAIERAKRLVEYGKDVFVLMDSLTRIGRAFNNAQTGGGRTMSGGVDARALEIPRRLFAAARNTEEAGSLTIVATALIETGSRMDELIFQEFKGTGNMELVLDRKISDQRIYPAADIFLSGTRREELLIPADDLYKINVIRRGLAGHKPIEAIERLLFFMRKYPTNAEMLKNIPG